MSSPRELDVEMEEMRSFVFQSLRYFSTEPDKTDNSPDIKTIYNLRRHSEELMLKKYSEFFERNPYLASDTSINENIRQKFREIM